jgi:hypothetical protein
MVSSESSFHRRDAETQRKALRWNARRRADGADCVVAFGRFVAALSIYRGGLTMRPEETDGATMRVWLGITQCPDPEFKMWCVTFVWLTFSLAWTPREAQS